MRTLPKAVAGTSVGKSVILKIWRDKKLISKRLTLGRLESSEEFKTKQSSIKKTKKEFEIEILKIIVRDVNNEDINSRKLNKKTTGAVIVEIQNRSPLAGLLSTNDIIIEVQKKSITKSSELNKVIDATIKKNEKTLLLTIINSNNRRRYLGVKIN